MVEIRKPYGKRQAVSLRFNDEEGKHDGRTEQHHKQLCDINNIIRSYDKTGLVQHVNQAKAMYGDFTEVNEYQESLNLVLRAQASFDELPSAIRRRFANDPGAFMEFVTNPENLDEMIKLGLANPPDPEPTPEPEKDSATAE